MALLAIIVAFGLSAFTPKPHTTSQKWYKFNGGDRTMAASYTLAPANGADPECSALPVVVCAILANDDGNGSPLQSDLDQVIADSNDFHDQADGVEYREE